MKSCDGCLDREEVIKMYHELILDLVACVNLHQESVNPVLRMQCVWLQDALGKVDLDNLDKHVALDKEYRELKETHDKYHELKGE